MDAFTKQQNREVRAINMKRRRRKLSDLLEKEQLQYQVMSMINSDTTVTLVWEDDRKLKAVF